MKKLSQSLKNKSLNSVILLTIFTVCFIFYSTIECLHYFKVDHLTAIGAENYFIFGGNNYSDPIGASTPNEFLFGILAFFISFLSFKFLHKKSLCLTTLSFPHTRASLFTKKTLLPLVLILLSGLITKTIALYVNYNAFGFSPNLINAYLINLLIFIHYVLFGFVLGILGRIFTGRTVEGILFSFSLAVFPKTVYFLVESLGSMLLHGYYDILGNAKILFFDPISYYFSYSPDFTAIYTKTTVPTRAFSHSIFWIAISVVALVFSKKYFVKNTKYEKTSLNNKYPLSTTFISIALPVVTATLIWIIEFRYNTVGTKKTILLIVFFILAALAGYVVNALISKSLRFTKFKAITVICVTSLPLLITVFCATGGLGYETRIPKAEKIDKIIIEPSVNITENADIITPDAMGDIHYFNKNSEFFTKQLFDSRYSVYNHLEFENELDFEKVFAFHNSAISDRNSETAESFLITYELKNGTKITREYTYLSEKTVEKLFELWDTETIKNNYENWFLNADESLKNKKTATDFYFGYNEIALSKGADVTIHSIDFDKTTLYNLSDEDFLKLKTAINEDIQALTWEEWFKPTKTYGNISFCNSFVFESSCELEGSSDCFDYNIINDEKFYILTIPITAEMTHTVNFLENIGLMDKFNRVDLITKAYLIDTEECAEFWLSHYNNDDDEIENKSKFYHSVLFDFIHDEMPVSANSFGHPYYEALNQASKEVSGDELELLLEKANTKCYCGTDSKLLFVQSTGLINEIYIISE